MNDDPFSQVYDTAVKMLMDSDTNRSLVKLNNLITFDKKKLPLRDDVQKGNLPELIISGTGISSGNLMKTSNSSELVRRYDYIVTTGEANVDLALNPIVWNLCCILTNWKPYFGKLKWPTDNETAGFVKMVNLVNSVEGINDDLRNRGLKGWTCILAFEVKMVFDSQQMRDAT